MSLNSTIFHWHSKFLNVLQHLGRASGVLGLFVAAVLLAAVPHEVSAQGALGAISAITKSDTSSSEAGTAEQTEETDDEDDGESGELLETIDEFADEAVRARDILKSIIKGIPTIRAAMMETLAAHGEDRGAGWIFSALVSITIALAAGVAAAMLLARWGRKQFANMYKSDVYKRADKISYLYLRALLMFVGVGLFFAVGAAVYLLIGPGLEAANETAMVVFTMAAIFMVLRIIWMNFLVPDASTHRLIALSDEEANGLYRSILAGVGVSLVAVGFCLWMERLGLPEDIHKLALMAASALTMVILVVITISYRKVVARLIMGQNTEALPFWRKAFASVWHLIAVIYFVIAWGISSIRILLDLPDASGLVIAPLQVLLVAVFVYGLLILLIDRVLLPRLDTAEVEAQIAEDIQRAEVTEGADQDQDSMMAQAHAEAAEREADRSPFRALLDRGAAILVIFGSLDLLAALWGLGVAGRGSLIGSFVEVLLVVFLGYMAYEAVKILIDRQIAKEAPAEKDTEAEIGGAGESRISTLLPIFRNFLLITIVVIASMVVLAELGVNIAPLFAGAGVVGLAIGFGAQTLIRDIFSGAFYLIDDAFRKGEYIDIGSAKGTVEKISIRSMQLRHHRGALTTVPFGEIQQVENFSRDWAIMKLAFRVTYDTDVDKMRKIIKKFGQELLEDEYYGPMFLAPLKSQGIMSMEDSAMIARVKFTAKPGKQFELRKVIYAGLRDLFDKNGIKFAHRQVTVRVAGADGEEENGSVSPEVAKAAAGAAAMGGMLDEEAAAAGEGNNDPI